MILSFRSEKHLGIGMPGCFDGQGYRSGQGFPKRSPDRRKKTWKSKWFVASCFASLNSAKHVVFIGFSMNLLTKKHNRKWSAFMYEDYKHWIFFTFQSWSLSTVTLGFWIGSRHRSLESQKKTLLIWTCSRINAEWTASRAVRSVWRDPLDVFVFPTFDRGAQNLLRLQLHVSCRWTITTPGCRQYSCGMGAMSFISFHGFRQTVTTSPFSPKFVSNFLKAPHSLGFVLGHRLCI